MRKIIFFDIDGTIVTDAAQGEIRLIPDSAIKAIAKARGNGHLCFINSGRPYKNIDKDVLDIGFDGVISGCGTNIRIGEKEILNVTNPKNVCREILEACKKCRVNAFFERKDMNYFASYGSSGGWIFDFMKDVVQNGGVVSTDTGSEDFSFDKMCVFDDESSDIKGFIEIASRYFSIIDRGNHFYELVPKGCSKGNAMRIVAGYYNIEESNTYAIGDSENDIEMFNATPNSIGMGNGASIHPYVAFVTKSILDGGIEYALRHFNIID